jgi:signal transduction histidine kinase
VPILLVVVVVYAALDHVAQRLALLPRFEQLQHEQALSDLRRAVADLDLATEELDRRTAALARLDVAASYLDGGSTSFGELLLEDDFLERQELDLAFVVALDGAVRWSALAPRALDARGELRDFPRGRLSTAHPLTRRAAAGPVAVSGLMAGAAGPMLVSSQTIGGRGWLILGRLLEDGVLPDERGGAAAWTLDSPAIPQEAREILDQVTASVEPWVSPEDQHFVTWSVLEDVQNRPTILLRTATPASIVATANTTVFYALLSTVAIGLALLVVLQRLMTHAVVTPLARLTAQVVEIGARDDDTAQLGLNRDDEIGTLAAEFDAMLSKLSASRQALVATARSAGMSEIATGILHNIGNVLNSVVLSRDIAQAQLRSSELGKLRKLVDLLQEQDDLGRFLDEDPRGAKVVPFLEALTRTLEQERERADGELVELGQGIEHIRELVASQQAVAGRSTVAERINVAEQVERAIEITASATGGVEVEIGREFDALPTQLLDRHKLLEILVNLLQNARQAVGEGRCDRPSILVRLEADGERFTITVSDNGRGIAPEHLDRIFAHGFTTRRDGNGFGLHASANSARELGGALAVSSAGVGLGAEFTLTLPLQTADAHRGQAA